MNAKEKEVILEQLVVVSKMQKLISLHKCPDEVIKYIKKRPGWTTPAEFKFASGAARSLSARMDQIVQDLDELAEASNLVGR